MKKQSTTKIEILGVQITEETHPHLFAWAKNDPKWLEKTIGGLDKALGGKSNPASAMRFLEHDLEHG
jgi:hypothetical protein